MSNQHSPKPAITSHVCDSLVPAVGEIIKIRNLLPYDLCFDIIDPKLGVIVSFTLKTGADTRVPPKQDQILVGHLFYMDFNWTFAEKLNSLGTLKATEFVAEGGRLMHLGWLSDELGFAIYSPISVVNKTENDLSYFQITRGPNHHRGMKIYPIKADQPVLLNFDITELYVTLPESALQDSAEWNSIVPLDDSTNIVKCSSNGFDQFISSCVYPNSDGIGKSIIFTSASVPDETVNQIVSHEEKGWGTLTLRNHLPYDLLVEVTNKNRTKVPAGKQANITVKWEGVLVLHLFYMDFHWTSKINLVCVQQLAGIRETFDTLEFRAIDGAEIMYLDENILFADDLQMILSVSSRYWIENHTKSPILNLQQHGYDRLPIFTKNYLAPFSKPVLLNSHITRLFLAGAQLYGTKEDWKEIPLNCQACIDLAFEGHYLRIKVSVKYSSHNERFITLHEVDNDALNSACNQNKIYVNVRGSLSFRIPVDVVLKIEDEENKYCYRNVKSRRSSTGIEGWASWSGVMPTSANFTLIMDYMNEKWVFETRLDSLVPELCGCEFVTDQGKVMIVGCKYEVEEDGFATLYLQELPDLPSP